VARSPLPVSRANAHSIFYSGHPLHILEDSAGTSGTDGAADAANSIAVGFSEPLVEVGAAVDRMDAVAVVATAAVAMEACL